MTPSFPVQWPPGTPVLGGPDPVVLDDFELPGQDRNPTGSRCSQVQLTDPSAFFSSVFTTAAFSMVAGAFAGSWEKAIAANVSFRQRKILTSHLHT